MIIQPEPEALYLSYLSKTHPNFISQSLLIVEIVSMILNKMYMQQFVLRCVLFAATLCLLSAPNSRLISLQSENVEINPAGDWKQHNNTVSDC